MTTEDNFSVRFKNSVNFGAHNESGRAWQNYTNIEIDKERFTTVLLTKGVPSAIIDILFKKFDSNNDGKINRYDFERVLQTYGKYNSKTNSSNTVNTPADKVKESILESSDYHTNRPTDNQNTSVLTLEEMRKRVGKEALSYIKNGYARQAYVGNSVDVRY